MNSEPRQQKRKNKEDDGVIFYKTTKDQFKTLVQSLTSNSSRRRHDGLQPLSLGHDSSFQPPIPVMSKGKEPLEGSSSVAAFRQLLKNPINKDDFPPIMTNAVTTSTSEVSNIQPPDLPSQTLLPSSLADFNIRQPHDTHISQLFNIPPPYLPSQSSSPSSLADFNIRQPNNAPISLPPKYPAVSIMTNAVSTSTGKILNTQPLSLLSQLSLPSLPLPQTPPQPLPLPQTPLQPMPLPQTPPQPLPLQQTPPPEPLPLPQTPPQPLPLQQTPPEPLPLPQTPPQLSPLPQPSPQEQELLELEANETLQLLETILMEDDYKQEQIPISDAYQQQETGDLFNTQPPSSLPQSWLPLRLIPPQPSTQEQELEREASIASYMQMFENVFNDLNNEQITNSDEYQQQENIPPPVPVTLPSSIPALPYSPNDLGSENIAPPIQANLPSGDLASFHSRNDLEQMGIQQLVPTSSPSTTLPRSTFVNAPANGFGFF